MSRKRKPPRALERIVDLRLTKRILERVEVNENGCWIWQGHTDRKGYGQCWWKDRAHWVHRLAYAIFRGRIADGLTIHHTCYEHSCLNPEHLETATIEENASEGSRRYHESNQSTECPPDHP